MNNILQHIIDHWNKNFTGTSALEIADAFNIKHQEAIRRLEKLALQDLVSVQKARLGQPVKFHEIKTNADVIIKVPKDWEMVSTLIAFPKRRILEGIFTKEGRDYGVFTNRLHKGDSQIKHYYFKHEVLDRYLKYPDRYHIHDDVIGGVILTKDDYYFSLPENKRDSETFAQIRYGKRRLQNAEIAIAVIVHDLSELPYKEQLYWSSSEIKNPEFAKVDEEFEKYYRVNFEAEFLDSEDLLEGILKTVRNINSIVGTKIFKSDTDNSYLHYPVINTREAYRNAHKELFKIIGSDSLDKETIKELLQERFGMREKEIKNNKGQDKGQWALFKVLIEKIPNVGLESFQRCYEARRESAHKISKARIENLDFIQNFRNDCSGILEVLKRLEFFLRNKSS